MVETKNTKPFYNSGIPYGWKLMELGELFAFKNGVNAGKESYGKGVKFINVMEVIYHDYIFPEMIPGTVQISEEQKELYLVKDGDVLFNRTSETAKEIGLSAVYSGNDDVVFGGFVIRGRPIINALDNTFKRYCFRSNLVRNQIIKGGQGAVRTNIGQGDLSQVKIVLPPLQEQKAIAALLGKWDEAIHKNQQLIAQKEERKKWLMQNLLTGKMRLKGFNEEWEENKLEYFIDELKQKPKISDSFEVLTSAKSGLMKQTDYYGNNRITNRDDADYNVLPPNYLTYRSRSDDGLFTFNKNELGMTGLISGYYPVFTIVNGSIDFVLEYINYFRQKLTKYSTGTSQLVLSMNALKEAKFHLPNAEEQIAIAQVMQAADREIQLLKTKCDKLKEQKKGVMQQLLTGKIRIK
jgi:type I restriction enzyme S subunit